MSLWQNDYDAQGERKLRHALELFRVRLVIERDAMEAYGRIMSLRGGIPVKPGSAWDTDTKNAIDALRKAQDETRAADYAVRDLLCPP